MCGFVPQAFEHAVMGHDFTGLPRRLPDTRFGQGFQFWTGGPRVRHAWTVSLINTERKSVKEVRRGRRGNTREHFTERSSL
jgi:hypothetical protein